MDTYLLITSVVIFTAFVAYITIRFGWLKSISASFYEFPSKQKWIFTIGEWAFVLPIIIVAETPLMFFAGAFICFSAAASDSRSSVVTSRVHVIGATGGILMAMASIIIDYGIWWIPAGYLVFTLLVALLNMRNHTYWIEVVAYYLVFVALMLEAL